MSLFCVEDNICARENSQTAYYRISVGSSIKYLKYDDPNPRLPDHRGERLTFTTVPTGDWNVGQLTSSGPDHDKFQLEAVITDKLHSIPAWHDTMIDRWDLSEAITDDDVQCQGLFRCYTYHLGSVRVVASYEWYPHGRFDPEDETYIYSLVAGHDISPAFLGHLTEDNNRIIGYVVEHIAGRAATTDDLGACQVVLARLHELGIALGHLAAHHFLLRDDGKVFLSGFATAYETRDPKVFEQEMQNLPGALRPPTESTPPQQSQIDQKAWKTVQMIEKRDRGLHPDLMARLLRGEDVNIDSATHKQMLVNLYNTSHP